MYKGYKIRAHIQPENIFNGWDDVDLLRVDEKGSMKKYAELVYQALSEEFPGADVEAGDQKPWRTHAITPEGDLHEAGGYRGGIAEEVDQVIGEVWESEKWVCNAPKTGLRGVAGNAHSQKCAQKKGGDSMRYEVIEDNAGHLYLFVFRGEETIYAADGFEHFPGVLKESLEDLARTGTVEDWEPGNIEEPEEIYETLQDWINEGMGGAKMIADEQGVYPDRMGAAGMLEFAKGENKEGKP